MTFILRTLLALSVMFAGTALPYFCYEILGPDALYHNPFWGWLYGLPMSCVVYFAGWRAATGDGIANWIFLFGFMIWPFILTGVIWFAAGNMMRSRARVVDRFAYRNAVRDCAH